MQLSIQWDWRTSKQLLVSCILTLPTLPSLYPQTSIRQCCSWVLGLCADPELVQGWAGEGLPPLPPPLGNCHSEDVPWLPGEEEVQESPQSENLWFVKDQICMIYIQLVWWLCNYRTLSIARWSNICDIDIWGNGVVSGSFLKQRFGCCTLTVLYSAYNLVGQSITSICDFNGVFTSGHLYQL